jgi:serine/threonine protein phosphatase PrpC
MSAGRIIQEENYFEKIDLKEGELHIFSHKSVRDKPNQDCLGYFFKEGDYKVLIVSDGMGGHQGGEKASRIVCEALGELLAKSKTTNLREVFLDAIELADSRVKDLRVGAGATLTGAIIQNGYAQFFNCGDSASLLMGSRGKLKYRNIEHSPLGYGLESGLIPDESSEEVDLVEDNIVSNGIGFQTVRIELSQRVEVSEGDLIALMSDGVSGHFTTDEIVKLVTSGAFEERVSDYVARADLEPTKYYSDDNSLILFKI